MFGESGGRVRGGVGHPQSHHLPTPTTPRPQRVLPSLRVFVSVIISLCVRSPDRAQEGETDADLKACSRRRALSSISDPPLPAHAPHGNSD